MWQSSRPWLEQIVPALTDPMREAERKTLYSGSSNCVLRLDRDSAFKAGMPSAVFNLDLVYRTNKPKGKGMLWDDMVDECAIALAMAEEGVGPPIFGVFFWPRARHDFDRRVERWNMLVVMKRCDHNLHDFAHRIMDQDPRTRVPCDATRVGERCAAHAARIAVKMARMGYVHFDFKCNNVLVAGTAPNIDAVYAIDFERAFFEQPDPALLGEKARALVNMLLIAAHVGVFASSTSSAERRMFERGFAAALRAPLMELWLQALDRSPEGVERFGPGGVWLEHLDLLEPRVKHRLNQFEGRHTCEAQRLAQLAEIMVFEYFFDDKTVPDPSSAEKKKSGDRKRKWRDLQARRAAREMPTPLPSIVENWRGSDGKGWRYAVEGFGATKHEPLVRQLLQFALFRHVPPARLPRTWYKAVARE